MKVALLYWRHPQDVTQQFALMWSRAIENLGGEVTPLEIGSENLAGNLVQMISRQQVDLVLAITPEALFFTLNEKYLWQLLNAKFAVYFLDSPIYSAHKPMMKEMLDQIPADRLAFFVPEKIHAGMYQEFLDAHRYGHQVYFSPFGARLDGVNGKPYLQREYEIVLLGNADSELMNQHIRASVEDSFSHYSEYGDLFGKIVGFVEQQRVKALGADLLGDFVREFGIASSELFTGPLLKPFLEIDGYIKRYNRNRLVESLVDMPLVLFGSNWDRYIHKSSKWKIGGTISYAEQFGLFENSRCVINVDPNWGAGTHDRAYNAMAAGATVFTPENAYSSWSFAHGKQALLYGSPSDIQPTMMDMHSSLELIAKQGEMITRLYHGWEARMAPILSFGALK